MWLTLTVICGDSVSSAQIWMVMIMKETGSATALNLSSVVGVSTANEKERETSSMLCCGLFKLVKSVRKCGEYVWLDPTAIRIQILGSTLL